MLNTRQIKLVQTAVKAAGLRGLGGDGRYRLLLAKYKSPTGTPVKSCKQLNNWQLDDLLAICESLGWRYPSKADDYYRQKVSRNSLVDYASMAQTEAIKHLAGDLGWADFQLNGMIKRMTGGKADTIVELNRKQAWKITEALKAMLSRQTGIKYSNLKQIRDEMEVATDGCKQTCQVG